jgi:hypothetical protein
LAEGGSRRTSAEEVLPSLDIHLYFGSGPDLLLRLRSREIDCAVTSSRVADPKLFYTQISGTRDLYTVNDIDGQLQQRRLHTARGNMKDEAIVSSGADLVAFQRLVRRVRRLPPNHRGKILAGIATWVSM